MLERSGKCKGFELRLHELRRLTRLSYAKRILSCKVGAMANSDAAPQGFATGLSRLDQDIAETERRLAELRAMRASIQPFLEQYVSPAGIPSEEAFGQPTVAPSSLTAAVVEVFKNRPGDVLDVDQVVLDLPANLESQVGVHVTRDGVRNAIHYAVRRGDLRKDRRGRYALLDTSTPVAAGVDVNEESDSEGSSGEIGDGRDDTSAPPRDQGGGAHDAQFHLDRVGDRAPIGG
jgi:hypothetical protein